MPKKLEVEVEAPARLDLSSLRAQGPAPGELLQPQEPQPATGGAAAGAQQQQAKGACAWRGRALSYKLTYKPFLHNYLILFNILSSYPYTVHLS